MPSRFYPYEILRYQEVDGVKACERLQRGRWSSHVPLPGIGDKINVVDLAGGYTVSARLFTKHGDTVLMVTLYVT